MANFPPPSPNFPGINFNPLFFPTDASIGGTSGGVSYAYVDSTFLKKIGTAISNASSTTFINNVSLDGLTTLNDINNVVSGSLNIQSSLLTADDNSTLNIRGNTNLYRQGTNNICVQGNDPYNYNFTSGDNNICLGNHTGTNTTEGSYNIFMGIDTADNNILGYQNIGIGSGALSGSEGNDNENVAIGCFSLAKLQIGGECHYNTAVGNKAGNNNGNIIDVYGCTFLGYNTSTYDPNYHYKNSTAIGKDTVIKHNDTIFLGQSQNTQLSGNLLFADGTSMSTASTPSTQYTTYITDTLSNSNFYPLFTSYTGAGFYTPQVDSDNSLTYNPSSNVLTCPNFNGTASLSSSSVITNIISGIGIYYPSFTTSSGNQGLKSDTTNLKYNYGTQSLICPNFTGTASIASTISAQNVSATSTPINVALLNGTSGNLSVGSTTSLLYTPSTGVLQCSTFSGNVNGNCSGSSATTTLATNSSNIVLQSNASSTPIYLVGTTSFTNATNQALYTDSTGHLVFIPSTNALTLGGTTNGSISILGTSSSVTIAGAGTALSTVNGLINAKTITASGLITCNGYILLPTTTTPSLTFIANFLTVTGTATFQNFSFNASGTTNIIQGLGCSGMPVNGEWIINIYNGGSGTLTINSSLAGGCKTKYTAPIIVPSLGFAMMRVNFLNFNSSNYLIVDVSIVA
jgi:hypothetical protein